MDNLLVELRTNIYLTLLLYCKNGYCVVPFCNRAWFFWLEANMCRFSLFVYICMVVVNSHYHGGRVVTPLIGLTQHVCAFPNLSPGCPLVVVHFGAIGWIVGHHYLNFPFIKLLAARMITWLSCSLRYKIVDSIWLDKTKDSKIGILCFSA